MILMTVLYIIICVFLVLLVLLQQGKGAMGIIGGSSDTLLGSSAGNILTKTTSILAIIFISGALMLSVLSSGSKSKMDDGKLKVKKSASQTEAPEESSKVDEKIKLENPFPEENKTEATPSTETKAE